MAATARPFNQDPFQNHKFQVYDQDNFLKLTTPSGGFNYVALPELNFDLGEYREGLWLYSQKQSIRPHITQMTLHKGVFLNDTNLFKVAKAAAEGKTYRIQLLRIVQFHRTDLVGQTFNYSSATPSRELYCYNCVPMRWRFSADLDSLNSDISIEEMDLEVEYIRLFNNGQEVTV